MGTLREAVIDAAENFLREKESVSPQTAKSSTEILNAIRAKPEGKANGATDGTVISYLSYAASNVDMAIVSGGPGKGYWLDTASSGFENKEQDEAQISNDKGKKIKVLEKDLYPLVREWLQSKGYASKDLSTLKSGGKWSNPDLMGFERVEVLGSVEIEVVSCEVKLSIDEWERYIFEAISHKRFSNRSWFCYRVSEQNLPPPKSMEYYSEKYRVGIVQIVLSDKDIIELKDISDPDNISKYLDRIIERVPAVYDSVSLKEKRSVIERSGLFETLSFS